MFCGNCGNKIEDGVKFCPSCGAPLQPAVEPAAAQPVPEPVIPAAAQNNTYPQPTEPLQPEQPVQSVQSFPSEMPQYTQPAQNLAGQPYIQPDQGAAAAPVKKKKKGKAGLIAGLTAGAVVLGGGAVGYFCFHDDITRLVMGDKEYAKMITKNAVKTPEGLESTADIYAESYSMALGNVTKSLRTVGSTSNADSYQEYALASLLDSIAPTEKAFDTALPAGTSLSVDSDIEVKLGSVFAMLDNETTRKIIDGINKMTFKEKIANGDAKMMSFGIDDGSGHSGSAEIYLKDGSVLVTFPGITDKKFCLSKEDAEKITSKFASAESENVPKIDTEEVKRIRNTIIDIFYKKYDEAKISFTDNTEWKETVGKGDKEIVASVKGNDVKIELTGAQLKEIFNECLDFLKGDEYLKNYMDKAFGLDGEKYAQMFDKETEGNKNFKIEATIVIDHIVDVHNNVIGSGLTVISDNNKGEFFVRGVDGGDASAIHAHYSDDTNERPIDFFFGNKKTSATEGFALASLISDKNDIDFSFDCTYSDLAKKKFLDKDVVTGKFVIKLSDPDKFEASVGNIANLFSFVPAVGLDGLDDLGDIVSPTMSAPENNNPLAENKAIFDEIKKFTFTFENSIEGDVYSTSSEIALGDVGSLTVRSKAEKKNENIAMPDTAGALGLLDSGSFAGMETDLLKWSKGIISSFDNENGDIAKNIDALIEKSEQDAKFKKHFSNYNSWSVYSATGYANSISQEIFDEISATDVTEGVIKLWFKDGNCEIIDDAGVSDIAFEDNEYGILSSEDPVYAEVFFNKNVSNNVVGVTAVLTDDKTDLPSNLPTIYNYIDSLYPWEGDNGIIGEFVVGTSPYLYEGEPTTNSIESSGAKLDKLNRCAAVVSDTLSDEILAPASLTNELSEGVKTAEVIFKCDDSGSWTYYENYINNSFALDTAMSVKLITMIKSELGKLSDTFGDPKNYSVCIYISDGRYVGTAAIDDPNALSFKIAGMPGAGDFARGSFSEWADNNSDGEPDAGYIYDYVGGVSPVGTYAVKNSGPLTSKASGSSDSSYGYDGRWNIKTWGDQDIREISNAYEALGLGTPEWYADINGTNLVFCFGGPDYTTECTLEYGRTVDGKPAAAMIESGIETGTIAFDGTHAYGKFSEDLTEDENVTFELEYAGPSSSSSASKDAIRSIEGRWTGTVEGTTIDFVIDDNYVLTKYTDLYIEKDNYGVLNPTTEGFDVYTFYDSNGLRNTGNVTLNSDGTLTLNDTANNTSATLSRVSDTVIYDYYGDWTLVSYEGLSESEYCEKYNKTPDEFAINFTIGYYSTIVDDISGMSVWTNKNTAPTSVQIAYDSSFFFDCAYDSAADQLVCTLRRDDSDEVQTGIFERGTHAFG